MADSLIDLLSHLNIVQALEQFFVQGGTVLIVIAAVTFMLCWLVLERTGFFWRRSGLIEKKIVTAWRTRSDKHSWFAEQVRRRLISLFSVQVQRNLPLIKVIVVIAPLLGLLGTVTGMIAVFDILAITGGGNTRAMAAGVSKATIPTMAGMVVALIGIFCSNQLQKSAKNAIEHLTNQMSAEEDVCVDP